MTKEELMEERNERTSAFYDKYRVLGEIYADERCPAKVGDIIRGAGGYVKVEKIYYHNVDYICGKDVVPFCSFFGTVVNKKGVPYRGNPKKEVYPWSLKEVNGEKVKYDYNS